MRSCRLNGCFDRRVRRHEPAQQRVVDAGVEIDETHRVDLFLIGEAVGGLRGERAGRVVAAVGVAPFAPGVIEVAFDDRAALVRHHGDGTEMIEDEVARGVGAAGELLGDDVPVGQDVIVPGRGRAGDRLVFHRAGGGIVQIGGDGGGGTGDQGLFDALMRIVIGKGGARRALADDGHHVERGDADSARRPRSCCRWRRRNRSD